MCQGLDLTRLVTSVGRLKIKQKRRKNTRLNHAASNDLTSPDGNLKIFYRWNSRLDVFIASTSALMVFCLFYVLRRYSSFQNFARQTSPYVLAFYSSTVISLIMVKFRLDRAIGLESKRDLEQTKKLMLIRGTLEFVHIGILFVPVVYISGITNTVALSLSNFIPVAGNRLLNWLLSGLTYLMTGVIGNAGYDILKRVLKRLRRGTIGVKKSSSKAFRR